MVLTRLLLAGSLISLLLVLPGCGESSTSAPSVWGGAQQVLAESAELQGVRWRNELPGWKEWSALPQKAIISISGEWQMAGAPEPMQFQCRLIRQSGTLYQLNFQGTSAGQTLTAAGEMDWGRRSAALDFAGVFSPEQYRTYLGVQPMLQSGAAEVRGSMLAADSKVSFPALTAVPKANSAMRLGAFLLTGGKLERLESFSGKTEVTFAGMSARAGGMEFRIKTLTMDPRQAEFKFGLLPMEPWQSTVALQGEGSCSLVDGQWTVQAELPEPGVFRNGKLILPLSRCRISGKGDPAGGIWSFQGDGASASYLRQAGTVTCGKIRVSGNIPFLFQSSRTAFQPDDVAVTCEKIQLPVSYGQLTVSNAQWTAAADASGVRIYEGSAESAILNRKDGILKVEKPSWSVPLFAAGDKIFSPEAGRLQAQGVEWTRQEEKIRADQFQGAFLLKEHSWQMECSPALTTFSGRIGTLSLPGGRFVLNGSRSDAGWSELSGKGNRGEIRLPRFSGECGEWSLHLGLSQELQCRLFSWASRDWRGTTAAKGRWTAARFAVQGERVSENRWKGKVELSGGGAEFAGCAAKGVELDIPFGQNGKGKVCAAEISQGTFSIGSIVTEVESSPFDLKIRGRGRAGMTGGACFITGKVRSDFREGSVDYSLPMATLQEKEILLPMAGDGWFFSGKLGENGVVRWAQGLPLWQRKVQVSGFARNANCMIEDLSGELIPHSGEKVDGQILYRRLTSVAGESSNGEVRFQAEKDRMVIQSARFGAWGGHWKSLQNGEFQVQGVQVENLLPLEAWKNAVTGKFSGTVTLGKGLKVLHADLKSDDSGVLALAGLESFLYLPRGEFDMNALSFTTAAFRNFKYRKLHLRLIFRKNNVFLRISGEGRPGKAVPFVLEKDGLFRPALSGERGFDGNVELGCGYRISQRTLYPKKDKKDAGLNKN